MYCDISEAESADNRKMFQGHLYLCMPGWPCPGICIGALILNQRLTICQVSELENVCHPIPLSSWSGSVSNGCLYQSQGGESLNLNNGNVFSFFQVTASSYTPSDSQVWCLCCILTPC